MAYAEYKAVQAAKNAGKRAAFEAIFAELVAQTRGEGIIQEDDEWVHEWARGTITVVKDGKRYPLFVSARFNSDQLEVSPEWPRRPGNDGVLLPRDCIRASFTYTAAANLARPAKAAARDLIRRTLGAPKYMAVWDRVIAYAAELRQDAELRDETTTAVKRALTGKEPDKWDIANARVRGRGLSCDIRSRGLVQVTSLPYLTAAQVKGLADWLTEQDLRSPDA